MQLEMQKSEVGDSNCIVTSSPALITFNYNTSKEITGVAYPISDLTIKMGGGGDKIP